MTGFLLGALVAVGAVCVIEGLLLFGRAQLLLNHSEQLLGALGIHVAAVPSKSAPRTDGSDEQPHHCPLDEPDTEPIPAQRTDTAETQALITVQAVTDPREAHYIHDVQLARIFADADNWIHDLRKGADA